MKKIILMSMCLVMAQVSFAQHNIIPEPVMFEANGVVFELDNQIALDVRTEDAQVNGYVALFKAYLSDAGITATDKMVTKPKKSQKAIVIQLNQSPESDLGKEGYSLYVKEFSIDISANEAAGVFNALQTLKQLMPVAPKGFPVVISGCSIKDAPRFGWRGLMLDVSRHFFTVDEVKEYLDQMSLYKFNVMHWHLTDDQGWRIEIKSYPKLTEVGAWRVERSGRFGSERTEPKPGEKPSYGGFYTQEDIKEVVKYAAARNITILPEIDFPGHSMAALAAYPELSVNNEPKFVSPGSKFSEWYGNGKFEMLIENTIDPTDEKVYEFVDKVFGEVAELFPSEFIHMGGDEAYHGFWERDSSVQKFMKANNIKDSHALQSYFVGRVNKIINSKGKKMIGWDEILEGGLTEGAAVMSWRGMKGGIAAAKMGHEVVMSPTTFAYLDYSQGDHSVENKIYADLLLEKSYSFEPVPEGVNAELILGGQGNLWTEGVPTMQYAFYMTYPRAFALSESLWTPKEAKDWKGFVSRTETHFDRFDQGNVNISKTLYEPIVYIYKEGDALMCELRNDIENSEIYYSIDNTYPVKYAEKYESPFEVPVGNLNLRTQTYRGGETLGRELIISREDLVKRVKIVERELFE
ncbi:MAG: family 20 glycosylhydrolase [Reichenbachiella sp.]